MTQGRELRKFKRFPLSFPLTMLNHASPSANGMESLLINLSLEGAAIQTAKLLAPETPLTFSFPLTLNNDCVIQKAVVVHSKPQKGPGYQAGIRLLQFRDKDHFKLARYLKMLRLIQNTTLLFQKLTLDEVRHIISLCREERVTKGERLFTEKDSADCLYIVIDGAIRVFKRKTAKQEESLAVLEDGEVFGEMAILDGYPRAASAVADRPTFLLAMDRERFQPLMDQRNDLSYKVMWIFLRMLCQRLRAADQRFIEVLSGNHQNKHKTQATKS